MVEGADNRFESVERGPPSVSVSVSVVGVSARRRRRSFKRSVGLVGEERERLMKKKKKVLMCVLDPACRPRAVRGMQARTPPRVRDPSTVRCGKCSLLRCRPRAFPLPFTASVTRNFQIRPRADTRLRCIIRTNCRSTALEPRTTPELHTTSRTPPWVTTWW